MDGTDKKELNATVLAALEAPFAPELVRERVGHGGFKLKWVPARAVAQRLDQVLGIAGWDFYVHPVGESNTVAATLTIHFPDGRSATRMDFGYETGGSGESLKEASSDALRRAASLFGVARYLYMGEPAPRAALPPKSVNSVRETRYAPPNPVDGSVFDTRSEDAQILKAAMSFASSVGESNCPDHDVAWTLKPAGTSKIGKPYAAFYTCGAKDQNGWCKNKPSLKWLAANPIKEERRAEDLIDVPMDPPKFTSDEVGEELPF